MSRPGKISGNILLILCRFKEALSAYDRALALEPGHAGTWSNRGLALQNIRRLEEAQASFRRAIVLEPDLPDAHHNLGLALLTQGDFAQGLALFEWRKKLPNPLEARSYPQPLWTGAQDIRGRTLFVYIEQGLGDTIQFYRFLAPVRARGARIVLSAHDSILRLLQSVDDGIERIGWGQVPDIFDYHVPLMSLPLALETRLETIPVPGRILAAEPDRKLAWAQKIGRHGFRIGVAWQGNAAILGAEGKSFRLSMLEAIAKIPGIRLINLQKQGGSEQLLALPAGMTVETFAFDEGADAFLDTAAMMENLDLVLSADTAPAHLAGALGVPVWLVLKYVPDWRWFLDRPDSPWYPSMRLFRQPAEGDWAGVFREIESELVKR